MLLCIWRVHRRAPLGHGWNMLVPEVQSGDPFAGLQIGAVDEGQPSSRQGDIEPENAVSISRKLADPVVPS